MKNLKKDIFLFMIEEGGDDSIANLKYNQLKECINFIANFEGINDLKTPFDKELNFNFDIYIIARDKYLQKIPK